MYVCITNVKEQSQLKYLMAEGVDDHNKNKIPYLRLYTIL